MITLNGKYNFAHVMCDEIDENVREQILGILDLEIFKGSQIRIMADTHLGCGGPIGFTQTLNDHIVPSLVGVDIGCAIEAYKLEGVDDIDFKHFDRFVKQSIPSGFKVNNKIVDGISEEVKENVVKQCEHIEYDSDKALRGISSLGGGNHFEEIGVTPDGDFWLVIHTGSRGFGLATAVHHQNVAKSNCAKYFVGPEYKDLEYLVDEYAEAYLRDIQVAQEYAKMNRNRIAAKLLSHFGLDVDTVEKILTMHNYIDLDDRVIRKGAISAHEDERVLVPLNMRDGTIVGRGKGSKKWLNSAPHGAGRVMGRNVAKKTLSLEKFETEMSEAGVYSSCVGQSTLDECPDVYKDKDFILGAVVETLDVECILKPVYNFKATN